MQLDYTEGYDDFKCLKCFEYIIHVMMSRGSTSLC